MPKPGEEDQSALSLGPGTVNITETAREAMGKTMENLGLAAKAPAPETEEGEANEHESSVVPGEETGDSGDEGAGGDSENSEEVGGDSGGDPDERQGISDEELEEASAEGVTESVDLLDTLNSLAKGLVYEAPKPQEEGQPAPSEQAIIAPTPEPVAEYEVSAEDFDKAFSTKEGLQEVLNKAINNGFAIGQQQMMSNISMAVGKVVADSVELYVEYHAVKSRHPIVADYPDAYRYSVSEIEATHPDWERDKVLTHAVARLKLYAKQSAKEKGKVVDTATKPGGKPGVGSSVRQSRFTKDGEKPDVVQQTQKSMVDHLKNKEALRVRLGGKV